MALLLCLGTFLSRQACAQSEHFIEMEGASSPCIERGKLETAVAAELGSTSIPAGLGVRVQLSEKPGFVLTERDQIVAERRFESLPTDCEAQLRMLSVVIALAIEHKVTSDAEESAQGSSKPAPVRAADVPPEMQEPDQKSASQKKSEGRPPKPQRRQKTWGILGSGGVGYSFGLLPVPGPLVTGELGLVLWRGWSVEVGVLATDRMRVAFDVDVPPGSDLTAPDEAFSQALVQLVAGKAQVCYEPSFKDGALGLCGGLAAGRFHARGVEGFQPSQGQGLPWFSAFSRFTGRAPARGPFGVTLNADIFANFLRPGVELTGEGSVTRPVDTPVAGGAVTFGMFFVVQ